MNFVRSGFRTIRENPALIFAEIAWRWTFGATAWLLVIFTVRTIMQAIDVSAAEIALARSNDAYLIADAIVRVIIQVLPRLLLAMLLVVPALAIIWTILATVGRAATLNALLSTAAARSVVIPSEGGRPLAAGVEGPYVYAADVPSERGVILSEAERNVSDARPQRRTYTFRLLLSGCVRAVFSLATLLAFFGTVVLVSASINPRATTEVAPAYVLAWLFLAFLVACFWGLINWFLALSAIFIVRDGAGVWNALRASVELYRDHRRGYMSIASWFGFFRGAALVVALFAGFASIAAGWRAGLIASGLIALFYFAVADALYIARLAAYVQLAESPAAAALTATAPTNLEPSGTTPFSETETETETRSGLS